jgi:hypothetical protein
MVAVDCARVGIPDLWAIQCLARRMLDVRRQGLEGRLLYASAELLRLIAFAGLDGVLRVAAGFPPRG